MRPKSRIATACLVLVLLAAFAALVSHSLTADPPLGLSVSTGPFTDEGCKTHPAAVKARFGEWQKHPDQYLGWFHSAPLGTTLFYLSFKLFGVGLAGGRLLCIILGLLSAFLVFLVAYRMAGRRAGLLALFFYCINFNVLMFSRMAVFAVPVNFFLLLALVLWQWSGARRSWCFFSALAVFGAYLVKPSALMIWPAFALEILCVVALWWRRRRRDAGGSEPVPFPRTVGAFAAGFALAVVCWLFLWLLPRGEEIRASHQMAARMAMGGALWKTWLTNALTIFETGFFNKFPFVTVLSLLGVSWMLLAPRVEKRGWDRGGRLVVAWLVMALITFVLYRYRAARWQLLMVPPMIILAAVFLDGGMGALVRFLVHAPWGTRLLLGWGLLLVTNYCIVFMVLNYLPCWGSQIVISTLSACVLTAVAIGLSLALRKKRAMGRGGHRLGRLLLPLALSGSLVVSAFYYARWVSELSFHAQRSGEWMSRHLPGDAIVTGSCSATLCLVSGHYHGSLARTTAAKPGLEQSVNAFKAQGLLCSPEQFGQLPEPLRSEFRFVAVLRMKHGSVSLYERLPHEPDGE